jgi:hypothetical protein
MQCVVLSYGNTQESGGAFTHLAKRSSNTYHLHHVVIPVVRGWIDHGATNQGYFLPLTDVFHASSLTTNMPDGCVLQCVLSV